MNIIILCKPKPIQLVVDPNQKIYDYMCKFFQRPKNNFMVTISPIEKIDQEDYFSKFKNENIFIIGFYVNDLNGCSIQYTNPSLQKQTSSGQQQYGYCQPENDEISLSISQMNNSAKCRLEEKLEKLNIITKSILSSQNFENEKSSSQNLENEKLSAQSIQTNVCLYCTSYIEDAVIETPCEHFFHPICFTLIVENQILQKEPTLNCLCKKKLDFRTLFHLVDKYEAESFKHRFILNQLCAIEKNIQNKYVNEFRKCKNVKSCNFFYLNLPFIQKQHEYCPNCLWNGKK